jgi:cell division protein FtsB
MRLQRKPVLVFFFSFLLILGFFIFFGEKGILHRLRLEKELMRIKEMNAQLRDENQKLAKEVQRLRTEKEYIEEIARKELGLIKGGEILYQFDSSGNPKEKAK